MNWHLQQRQEVLVSVQKKGLNLEFADQVYQDDEQIVIEAVKQDPWALKFASECLKDDADFMMMLKLNACTAEYMSTRLKHDYDFMCNAIKENNQVFFYVHSIYGDDEAIVLEVISKNGGQLKYASPRLQDEENIVFKAVANDWKALAYVSDRLAQNMSLYEMAKPACLEAIKKSPTEYKYASEALQKDDDILVELVTQEPIRIKYFLAQNTVKSNKMILRIVSHNALVLEHLTDAFKNDIQVVFLAIQQNVLALKYASYSLRNNKDVILTAMRKSPYETFMHMEDALKKDEDVLYTAACAMIEQKLPFPEGLAVSAQHSYTYYTRIQIQRQQPLSLQLPYDIRLSIRALLQEMNIAL
jgi:hypothetical protein